MRLQQLVKKRHAGTPTEFSILEEWEDLLLLTGQVNYDHLLVVVSAVAGLSLTIPLLNVCRRNWENISLIIV